MKITIFCITAAAMASTLCHGINLSAHAEHSTPRTDDNDQGEMLAQASTEMLGALMGGGGGGGGGGPSGGCAQNTPAINIIDNARIMMMPGNIPAGGSFMAQADSETSSEGGSQTLA